MKILVTGNLGYIGTVLTDRLLDENYEVVGLDIGFFKDCNLINIKPKFRQIIKDIRAISKEDLKAIDSIIHLAGLSNDPIGELSPKLTEDINFLGTIKLAKMAKELGIKRFIYASSQSMYGISKFDDELDEDKSEKKPITAYAKTKWEAECKLSEMHSSNFNIISFRPSTVFGVSSRLRCDVAFNNLVACAFTTGKIEIKSDGTPWRPVVHVQDVCSALISGLKAPLNLVAGKSFNVGIPNGNFTIRELAIAAQKSVPGSKLIFTNEHGKDSRTYKVSFKKILSELKDFYKPKWDLNNGGKELVDFFNLIKLKEEDFRGKKTNRLMQLKFLQNQNTINKNLNFINS